MTHSEPPIIDSHIHLYAEKHLPRLNWTADLPSDHILNRQNSVEQYKATTRQNSNLRGFIFVETDRKSSHGEAGWRDPIEEVGFLARIARGDGPPAEEEGEGYEAADSSLVLGIVPWAPVVMGPTALERYVSRVREACEDERTFRLVKGYRYLLQDKPVGIMLKPEFVAGLQWLGSQGLTFDLGVDLRQGGVHQLREACVLMQEVFRGGGCELRVVIDHFCKPNLRLAPGDVVRHEDFFAWSQCVKEFAGYPTMYMKFSGLFSEMAPQEESTPASISSLVVQVMPWVDVVFREFGPSRIMFGSDWPVCMAGGPGSRSWQHWVDLVTAVLEEKKLTDGEKARVWSGTAQEVYSVTMPA